MNWTGGTLQRTKNANKSVIQKQKAYFARARTQLQQGPATPATPFRPDYLNDEDDSELGHYLPSFGKDSAHHTGHSVTNLCGLHRRDTSPAARRSRHKHYSRKSCRESPRSMQERHKNEVEKGE